MVTWFRANKGGFDLIVDKLLEQLARKTALKAKEIRPNVTLGQQETTRFETQTHHVRDLTFVLDEQAMLRSNGEIHHGYSMAQPSNQKLQQKTE